VDSKEMNIIAPDVESGTNHHINNALKEELADSEEVVAIFATTTYHGDI